MKKLLLLTDNLPFGNGESFLYPEIEFLTQKFSITVVTTDTKSDISSSYIWDFPVYRIQKIPTFWETFQSTLQFFFTKDCLKELGIIFQSKKQVLQRSIQSIKYYAKAQKTAKQIERLEIITEQDLVYSYWHNYKVLGMGLLLKKLYHQSIPIVSRIHGYDLYNERVEKGGRQPFKYTQDEYLSALYFVSEKGLEYYRKTFGFNSDCAYLVSRLGVYGTSGIIPSDKDIGLSLISVSHAIPLKRVELIISALELITEYTVSWVHFGDGESMNSLTQLAEHSLKHKKNISYVFKGHITNQELHTYYETHTIDVFITTSSTEGGCPVSIQEAFSYGVPAIGTDVGGITEMITGGYNGFLFNENPTALEVKTQLDTIYAAKINQEMDSLKTHAFSTWERFFDAEKNFSEFAKILYALCLDKGSSNDYNRTYSQDDLISVIVPIYNAEKTLDRCITSIIGQTYQNLQIILINDGSVDESIAICRRYAEDDVRIKVINSSNQGVSKARNQGMDSAEGAYWGFVDSDDWIEPTFIETMYSAIQENEGCCLSSLGIVSESWKEYLDSLCKGDSYRILSNTEGLDEITAKFGLRGYLCNKLFLPTHLRLNPDINVCEDLEFIVRYLYHHQSNKIVVANTCLYHYEIIRPDTIYSDRYSFRRNFTAFQAYEKIIEQLPDSARYLRDRIYSHTTELAYNMLVTWYSLPKSERTETKAIESKIPEVNVKFHETYENTMKQSSAMVRVNYFLLKVSPSLLIPYLHLKFRIKKLIGRTRK
jgi:glycosyltransferase involved in cell wall biosynthesis